ncbi:hypothetical protein DLM75_05625 [Leptospira stimsonii]|uniref:Uncharacterized protein n=1 Tax=Leptospira stimsonii TaxID=2202203 RepID=A0A396ZFZ2_9LEPT|nr:hypothetical protein DLM75_05625 [Leptospira stimsonii]
MNPTPNFRIYSIHSIFLKKKNLDPSGLISKTNFQRPMENLFQNTRLRKLTQNPSGSGERSGSHKSPMRQNLWELTQ